jgi:predicted ABC-type ATPase
MKTKNLYIIAGCNGAGKTTASFTILPEMLKCQEFINADEIARELDPIRPESVAIKAGRVMLTKIKDIICRNHDFAFETTLSPKSHVRLVQTAKNSGYAITLIFFWLDSVDLAVERVKNRVLEGGHDIPNEVIYRRYYAGLINLFRLYLPISDYWMIFNNSSLPAALIAEGYKNNVSEIKNSATFATIKKLGKYEN